MTLYLFYSFIIILLLDHVNLKKNEIQKVIDKENNSSYVQGIVIALGIKSQVELIETTFEQMGYIVYKEAETHNTSCSDIACLIKAIAEGIEYPDNIKHVIFYFAGYGGSDRLGGSSFITGKSESEILPLKKYVIKPLQNLNITQILLFDCYHSLIKISEKPPVKPNFTDGVLQVIAFALHKFESISHWTSNLCNNLKNKKDPIGNILEEVFSIDKDLERKILHCNLTTEVILCANMYKLEYFQALNEAIKENGSICCSVLQCMPFGPPQVGKTHFYHRLLNIVYENKVSTGVMEEKGIITFKVGHLCKSSGTKMCVVKGEKWESVEDIDEEILLYLESIKIKASSYKTESNADKDDSGSSDEVQDTAIPSGSTENEEDTSINIETKSAGATTTQVNFTLLGNFHAKKYQEVPASDVKDVKDDNSNAVGSTVEKPSIPAAESNAHEDNNSNHDELISGLSIPDCDELKVLFEDSATMFYTDTGGQPEFQEVLPCLVGGPTLFLLVFDLSKGLNKQYKVVYTSYEKCDPYESTFTVKEVMLQYLSTIWSYYNGLSQEDRCSVKILILATHKDKVTKREIVNVNKLLKSAKIVKTIEENSPILIHDQDDQKDQSQVIIPINNLDEDDGDHLRKIIEDAVLDKKSKYRQPIAVNWLGFELALRKIDASVVPLKECIKLAKKYGIKNVKAVLAHLHNKLGVIRYYQNNEKLENFVVTKPSLLFEAISNLIVKTFKRDNAYKNYGLLKEEDIRSVYSSLMDNKELDGLKYNYFLAFLEHFNILIPAVGILDNNEVYYFLPCALTHTPPKSCVRLFREWCYDQCEKYPLLLSFHSHKDNEVQFIPVGFFSSLLGFLCKQKTWSITRGNNGRVPEFYRNQAIFSARVEDEDKSYPFNIKLELKHSFIEFTIMHNQNTWVPLARQIYKILGIRVDTSLPHHHRQSICQYVYNLLKVNVPDIRNGLQCTKLEPIFGLYCCYCKNICSKISPHFAKCTGGLRMKCSESNGQYDLKPDEDVQSFWFDKGILITDV